MDAASILRYRLAVNHLSGGRLPGDRLAVAAGAGLQDGSPWSGLLSLHARVEGVETNSWRDPSLAQVFGPRGAVYLVPRSDIAVFTLGVFPVDERHAEQVRRAADAIAAVLDGDALSQREVMRRLPHLTGRTVRWAGTTGTLLPVWDTTDTIVSTAPAPPMDANDARRELARRFFRYLGPATIEDLAWFVPTSKAAAKDVIDELDSELVRLGGGRLVTAETAAMLDEPPEPDRLLLLPPEDAALNRRTSRTLVPEEVAWRLWPKAPPPGIVVADGKPVGAWRRRSRHVTLRPLVRLSGEQQRLAADLVEALPLPGSDRPRLTIEAVQQPVHTGGAPPAVGCPPAGG
jgi:DNA glycosylase AlkZ-like